MFDMHYDLLSVAYCCYLKGDYSYLEEWCKAYRDNNVRGVVGNLYFMSLDEMKEELHPDYYRDGVSVCDMFQISTNIIKEMLPDTELMFSIEGCDFLEVSDLDELYDMGLRNILPVWNNQNKYGSGNRSHEGLTEKGKQLLDKVISLGISIDLSHANRKTFDDVISYLKERRESREEFFVMASHSNARSICDRERNLDDDQIVAIKELDGLIGVFSNRNFIVPNEIKDKVMQEEKEAYYLRHIEHVVNLIGVDHVGVATDDMDFCKDADYEYGEVQLYPYQEIASNLRRVLGRKYDNFEVAKIMYGNMKDRYDRINNRLMKGRNI